MKKWVVTSALMVAALGFQTANAGWFGGGSKGPKVGFILSTMQEERYQRDKKVFEETIEKLGGEVIFASCNNSEQTQASHVDNLLSQGVDVLVIQPVNGDTASAFVKQAQADGVPVIAYDRLIKSAPLAGYITEDSLSVGRMQAEAAIKQDRKSTRLNSSHLVISYAVFCLKKKR